MWRDARGRLEFVDSEKLNVYILQVMSILRQIYCSPKYLYFLIPNQEKTIRNTDGTRGKEILIKDAADFVTRWEEAVDAIETAIEMLKHPQEFGVSSSKYLPYVSILPVFAALQAHMKEVPPEIRLDAQRKIRFWYWASVFTSRYSGSVESTSARDYKDVRDWISNAAAEPQAIQDFKTRFKSLELRKEVKSGGSIYNGIFNLLVLQGARDWITAIIPHSNDLDDHHIVPSSWGSKHLSGNSIHTILNRTPLSSETNRHIISDRLPNEYLPELIEKNGEAKVRGILESHLISPAAFDILLRDPFTPEDFEEFIAERQRSFQDAIENLLIKERLDLPPNLRAMDQRIENTELSLRALILEYLEGNSEYLPPHVNQKMDERIKQALKKNAALDADFFETLEGKLEYSDLREIQDTILSKANWEKFLELFTNKETLTKRFGQLADLRNSIRHSRTVDEVTQKEGEAALVWFEKVIKL